MPQPQQLQVPPKQVIYNGAMIDVVPQPGGVMLQISVPGCGELLVFPLSAEVAKVVGEKLSAPRIQVAPAALNGNGRH